MKTLIIYESFFSNTEKIAKAMGDALVEKSHETKVLNVSDFSKEDLSEVEFLVVGTPTRAFRPVASILNFVKKLDPEKMQKIEVAAFDTRMRVEDTNLKFLKTMSKMFGYAAEPLAKKLEKKGGYLVLEPMGFYVEDSEGPIKKGEIKRAQDWVTKAMNK